MKKILSVFLVFLMMFSMSISFASCNGDDNKTDANNAENQSNNQNNNQNSNQNSNQNDTDIESEVGEYIDSDTWYFNEIVSLEQIEKMGSAKNSLKEKLESRIVADAVVSLTSANGEYTLYVDKYTTVVYYVNNSTNEILSSNRCSDYNEEQNSPITVFYKENANSDEIMQMNSFYAALKGNFSIKQSQSSIVVSYALDNRYYTYIAPIRITASKLERELIVPLLNEIKEVVVENCADENYNGIDYDIFKSPVYNPTEENEEYSVYYNGNINPSAVDKYLDEMSRLFVTTNPFLDTGIEEFNKLYYYLKYVCCECYDLVNISEYVVDSEEYINIFNEYYSNQNSEIGKTLEPIYVLRGGHEKIAYVFEDYLPEYTVQDKFSDQEYCGIEVNTTDRLKFNCAVEYSLDDKGKLGVSFYDKTKNDDKNNYVITDISFFDYFSGNVGFNYPEFSIDGSKTVVEMKSSEKANVSVVKKDDLDIYLSKGDFDSKLANGELITLASSDGNIAVYIDKYTGSMYATNKYGIVLQCESSDISILYESKFDSENVTEIEFESAVINDAVSVEQKENSIIVNYVLSNEKPKFLLPDRISAEKLERILLVPMLNKIRDLMVEYCADENYNGIDYDIFKASKYNPSSPSRHNSIWYNGAMNSFAAQTYLKDMNKVINKTFNAANGNIGSPAYKELQTIINDFTTIYASTINCYTIINLNSESTYADYYKEQYYNQKGSEISETLEPIYVFSGEDIYIKATRAAIFSKYLPDYTEDEMIADESYCGVNYLRKEQVELRFSAEWAINADGNILITVKDNTSDAEKVKIFTETLSLNNDLNSLFGDGATVYVDGNVINVSFKTAE